MLFFVKYRLNENEVANLAEAIQSGKFGGKVKYLFTAKNDSFLGVSFWEADSQKDIDDLMKTLKSFADVQEVFPVESAKDVQERLINSIE